MRKVFFFLCLMPFSAYAAPDVNGYEAKYECRASGTVCNVDVASLAALSCDQTITTADSEATIESKINGGSRVICVTNGDYMSKGTIDITADGTSTQYKVLRYTRGSDTDDDPWDQSDGNKAKFYKLWFSGANFWLIHRLTMHNTTSNVNGDRIFLENNSDNIIFNRMLVEGRPTAGSPFYAAIGSGYGTGGQSDNITLQNSVVRNNFVNNQFNCIGIAFELGTSIHLVNNEIYDWCEHNVQMGHNGGPTMPDFVMENNDIYHTVAMQGMAEDVVAIKAEGTSSQPMIITQNRIWGGYPGSSSLCCGGPGAGGGGGSGIAVSDGSPFSYILIKNNIIFDNEFNGVGFAGFNSSSNWSLNGNIMWNNRGSDGHFGIYNASNMEFYLNTLLPPGTAFDGGGSNTEYRCNVHFNTQFGVSVSPFVSFSTNVYYSGTSLGSGNLTRTLLTRANSTTYLMGDIVRRSANPNADCSGASDSDCYLYRVTTPGTSAGSPPTYCTTLGCTQTDGSVTLRAARGPFVFWRKLLTTAESITVPYARTSNQSPDYLFCPGTGETGAVGSTAGIGVNNSILGQSGTDFWNSIVGPR